MSSSGKRLRISLLIAVSAVSINVYSVLDGAAGRFYAELGDRLFASEPATAAPMAQAAGPGMAQTYSFAALELRNGIEP